VEKEGAVMVLLKGKTNAVSFDKDNFVFRVGT